MSEHSNLWRSGSHDRHNQDHTGPVNPSQLSLCQPLGHFPQLGWLPGRPLHHFSWLHAWIFLRKCLGDSLLWPRRRKQNGGAHLYLFTGVMRPADVSCPCPGLFRDYRPGI